MGFFKEDYYDECKAYCTYTDILDLLDEIEDEARYDERLDDIPIRRIRDYVKDKIDEMEKIRLGRVLKE